MKLRLQVHLSPSTAYLWEYSGSLIRLGRNPAGELPFTGEGNQTVSWEHARLEETPEGLVVRDLRSSNGTYVNGQVIIQPTRLRPGDEIGLGQTGPRLQVLEMQTAGTAAPVAVAVRVAAPALPVGRAVASPPPGRARVAVAALQGNGRPVTLPLTPVAEPAPSASPVPVVNASNTRMILLAMQSKHRRVWVLAALFGVGLLALVGGGIYVLYGLNTRNADKTSQLSGRIAEADQKAKKAEAETRTLTGRIAQAAEKARKAEEEARKAKEDAQSARAQARKAEEEARHAREQLPILGQELYTRTLRSTAYVAVHLKSGARASGTGSLIDKKRRLVLTAYHVVDNTDEVAVIFPSYEADGKVISDRAYYHARLDRLLIKGRVVASNPQSDLALIQLESLPADVLELPLAAGSPSQGARVHTVGNPGASAGLWAYTVGAVRQVARHKYTFASKQTVDAFVVETQNPINRGDSGGPVVNDKVELVAVNSGGTNNIRDGTLCIDIREVKALLTRL